MTVWIDLKYSNVSDLHECPPDVLLYDRMLASILSWNQTGHLYCEFLQRMLNVQKSYTALIYAICEAVHHNLDNTGTCPQSFSSKHKADTLFVYSSLLDCMLKIVYRDLKELFNTCVWYPKKLCLYQGQTDRWWHFFDQRKTMLARNKFFILTQIVNS